MSDEGRRVFKMDAVLGLIAGKQTAAGSDLLGYLSQRDLAAEEEAAVAPIAKGWLYSQHPAFMQSDFNEMANYDEWVKKECARLGDNVSLQPIPAAEMAGINGVLDKMAEFKATIAAKTAENSGLAAQIKELTPFKGQAADLEKKLGQSEQKVASLNGDIANLRKELAPFQGKVAIDEKEIESSVKDMVSRAVKDALKALPLGAAAGAAVAGAAAEGEAASFEESSSDSGGVPDTFGFGASGASDDGFGF